MTDRMASLPCCKFELHAGDVEVPIGLHERWDLEEFLAELLRIGGYSLRLLLADDV